MRSTCKSLKPGLAHTSTQGASAAILSLAVLVVVVVGVVVVTAVHSATVCCKSQSNSNVRIKNNGRLTQGLN